MQLSGFHFIFDDINFIFNHYENFLSPNDDADDHDAEDDDDEEKESKILSNFHISYFRSQSNAYH